MLGDIELTREQTWNLALTIGKVLLKSGAETSRVEDTIARFCYDNGCEDINIFVTPTVIILGDTTAVNPSLVFRVRWRSTNLANISRVNDFTYNLKTWTMNYEETMNYLEGLLVNEPSYGNAVVCFGSAMTGGFFSYLLGGSVYDLMAAFITAGITMCLLKLLSGYRMSVFWENAVTGFSVGFMALACCTVYADCNSEKIIAGAFMPFLPGLAFTNGLRDYMAGDLISGNSRTAEALLFAISLAIGLAASLIVWRNWGLA